MELFLKDLRHAARGLVRAPGFAGVAILTLALGIGANTAVFSLVQGLLLRPLPYPEAERLVQVFQTEPDNPKRPVAPANFLDWRRDSRSFDGLAAFTVRRRNLLGEVPEQVEVASVSASFLRVLGLRPGLGRDFGAEDRPEAVLGHALWQRAFGGDPGVLGRTLRLDESAYEIVGVLPAGPAFPVEAQVLTRAPRDIPEVGVPIEVDVTQLRDARFLGVLGRLAPQASLSSARAEMSAIAQRLERQFPEENARCGINLVPLRESLVGGTRATLSLMAGAVALVLLIAGANVASLLLVRSLRREREIAIRTALGASRGRLAGQLLAEGAVLAGCGAAGGLLLAGWGGALLRAALPGDLPAYTSSRLDAPVLAFSVLVSAATALVFSLVPIAHARLDPGGALHGGRGETSGPRRHRLQGILVATELALAVVLVTAAGLLLKSLWRLENSATGVESARVVTLRASLPAARTLPEPQRKAFFDAVIERLEAVPGVEAAGAVQTLPFAGRGISAGLRVEGRTFDVADVVDTCWRAVTPGYFRALGIPVVRGHGFEPGDGASAPRVALINARLARLLWPDSDPIGQRIGTGMDGDDDAYATVVGVVGDAPQEGVAAEIRPEMYRPLAQPTRFAAESMSVAVRIRGAASLPLASLREAVRAVNRQAPVTDMKRLEDLRRATTARQRGAGAAIGVFGALALVLAAVGLYGTLAFVVGERSREFGVRLALGARPAEVVRQVLARALRLVGAGLLAGLGVAIGFGRVLAGLLHGVAPQDAPTLAGVVVVLGLVALLSGYLPARRAARVDPALALRHE
ncbi:MAG TPA: ABC transporter permease [Vicinamibacteria bacterium]|nr:ABC transporter permease [Vicinamibacteria bacterium]